MKKAREDTIHPYAHPTFNLRLPPHFPSEVGRLTLSNMNNFKWICSGSSEH